LLARTAEGVHCNFSMGTPNTNPTAWPAFYPAIDAARANGGILGLHEYGTPMQQYFDAASGDGWLCGRYRKVYRQFLIPSNRSLPLAITEAGVDGVAPVGWKNHFTSDQYMAQLQWYDSLMRADGCWGRPSSPQIRAGTPSTSHRWPDS
jgi:hypothetical protein